MALISHYSFCLLNLLSTHCNSANKFDGVRAGTCHDSFSAHQSVEDDDANVLCIGARIIGPALAAEIVKVFIAAQFSHAERHQRRIDKVEQIEREQIP